MELTKSHWIADENTVQLSVPFSKVDKENRLVSGFATLDNIDSAKDVVTAEASKSAFERAKGNVREMHQPIAAGRVVDFREDEFFHNGEFYRGIYATAYVSKGAEDTWQKVLDGTLSGFSIGGNITDQETKFVKDAGPNGEVIRFIKGYDLAELSLVDNPCNDLANLDSIVKMLTFEGSAGNKIMKGMVAETVIVNVFWCPTEEIAKNSKNATEKCLSCGSPMEQIGWFEQGEDNAVKTASAVANFLRQKEDKNVTKTDEGGVEKMADKEKEEEKKSDAAEDAKAEEKAEAAGENVEVKQEEGEPATLLNAPDRVDDDEDEDKDAEETDVDAVALAEGAQRPEDSAETSEEFKEKREAAEEEAAKKNEDVEKMFSDLKDAVTTAVEDTVRKIDERTSEFEKSLESLRTDFEEIRKERSEVTKRLEVLEGSSAVKKSGEVESEPVKKAKESLWAGTFFDARD
jgi:hypothetical protein